MEKAIRKSEKKKEKEKKKKKEKRSAKIAHSADPGVKAKPGLFRTVSQVFSGQKETLKSPRDSSKPVGSPKSARQRFAETPSSVRTPVQDGDLYEGVLMVDDIFESKGILVDLRFNGDGVEMVSPSTRSRFPYNEIPAFRLYDKLHVWEFHWHEPPMNGARSVRRVFKFKDLRFKELNESARSLVANAIAQKLKARDSAAASQTRESISASASVTVSQRDSPQQLSPSSSRSERPSSPVLDSERSSARDESKKNSKFTELYFDICDILLEETSDGEFVTLTDLSDMVPKDRLPWRTTNSAEEALWEFCSLYPETFTLEEDEAERLVVGLLSVADMMTRLEDHIMASPLHRARPAIVTHTVFSREALRDQTLDQFVQRSRVFKWRDGYVVMRKSAMIESLQEALAQKQEDLDEAMRELERFREKKARKEERRRRRDNRSPSPSPPQSRPASIAQP